MEEETAVWFENCRPQQQKRQSKVNIKLRETEAFFAMKSSMNLITASDAHFMMMIYDDPGMYARWIFMNE